MNRRLVDEEDPDRLYTITGGRSRPAGDTFDLVTLIVSECDPSPGMQREHAKILSLCREPVAVVELCSDLGLPVSVVKILLSDLMDMGKITARPPSSARIEAQLPTPTFLEQVLVGLRNL